MVTTRWVDNYSRNIDTVMELLSSAPKDEVNDKTVSYVNWNVEKLLDSNENIRFNGNDITFNCIEYSYDQVIPGYQPLEDRTSKYKGFVIIYYNGIKVNYIISRNSDAQRILRKLLKYTGRNEINKNMFRFDKDFFIWLISKVYTRENTIEASNEDVNTISLDMIKGFKGDTEDLLNKVTTEGESVINIISTLSFLLESGNINQITLELSYGEHKCIILTFNNCGDKLTITTDREAYRGVFENNNKELVLYKLMLLLYLEIVPILVQSYKSDLENGEWNRKKNISFLEEVAKELSDRVAGRIKYLNEGVNPEICAHSQN